MYYGSFCLPFHSEDSPTGPGLAGILQEKGLQGNGEEMMMILFCEMVKLLSVFEVGVGVGYIDNLGVIFCS